MLKSSNELTAFRGIFRRLRNGANEKENKRSRREMFSLTG